MLKKQLKRSYKAKQKRSIVAPMDGYLKDVQSSLVEQMLHLLQFMMIIVYSVIQVVPIHISKQVRT